MEKVLITFGIGSVKVLRRILMEGGKSVYSPLLYCKVLDTTSCKVIAFVPSEYVIFAREKCILKDCPIDGSLLSREKPCIGAFPLFLEEAIFHALVGLVF